MLRLKLLALLVAIIVSLGAASQVVFAGLQGPPRMVVILVDREAVAESSGSADLARSFIGLVSTLREGQFFVYVSVDEPSEVLGPVLAGDQRFRTFQKQLEERLISPKPKRQGDMVDALATAYNLLGREHAAIGSTVYLMTGGPPDPGLARLASKRVPMIQLFDESGWPIVGLSLPGSSLPIQQDLRRISVDSGGDFVQLSVPNGLKLVSDRVLRDDAKGSLLKIGEGELTQGKVLSSFVDVAPGTSEATLMFFKEHSYSSLRLSNPSGFEASLGDRRSSSVVETPHVVIWKLIDPTPGRWKVDVRGEDGMVSAWHFAVNKYSLVLEDYGPVPLEKPATLVASVRDQGEKVVLDGVRMTAKVTSPDGVTLVYELNDDGVPGDAVAGDGYFSTTISPVVVEGEYRTELELSWVDFEHRISSEASFATQGFPAIELTRLQIDELRPGLRTAVARIVVQVQGQPYAIKADELTSSVSSNADEDGLLEIKPRELMSSGRAWLYDVFLTPAEEGLHTLIFHLSTEYAGRRHTFTTGSFVVSSTLPSPPPVEPVVELAPVAPVTVPGLPPRIPAPKSSGFPWALLAIPAVIVVVAAIVALYWRTLTWPYGFLYNDRNELLVDFRNLKRRRIIKMLFKDSVPGTELGVEGLQGVSFKFRGESIDIRSRRPKPTVRVNSEPLIGEAAIGDMTWIGTHGKLYSFLTSPPAPLMDPGMADD